MRNLWWSTGILALIGVLAYGLPAVDAGLPAARPVAVGRPYPLGREVTVVPPAGARVDVTASVPGGTLFVLNGVRYLLVVAAFDGTLAQAAARVRQKIIANRGYQVAGGEIATRTDQWVPGRQGGYTSPGRDGRYAVFLAAGTSVEVTIAGTVPELRPALPALSASLATLAFPRS